jgi:hypothetical protein
VCGFVCVVCVVGGARVVVVGGVCTPQRCTVCMDTISMEDRVCECARADVAPSDARTHHVYMVGCTRFEFYTKSVRVHKLLSYKIQTDENFQL